MSEQLYDDVIAPKLKELSDLCQANGMPFLAVCEYAAGEIGRTEFITKDADVAMHIAAIAARAGNNVDGLFIGIARYCARHGIDTSKSIVLSDFGHRSEGHPKEP